MSLCLIELKVKLDFAAGFSTRFKKRRERAGVTEGGEGAAVARTKPVNDRNKLLSLTVSRF